MRLRDEGEIGDEVLRRVQRDLDMEGVLLTGPELKGEKDGCGVKSDDGRQCKKRKNAGKNNSSRDDNDLV
jgi:hypothetical protein